jgi:hypothetical protein
MTGDVHILVTANSAALSSCLSAIHMVRDVSEVFRSYLKSNLGPDLDGNESAAVPDYGISATVNAKGVVDVVLTFKRGCPYCCAYCQCHFGLFDGDRWVRLRAVATSQDVELAALLSLRIKVIVEEGALFYDTSQPESEQLERRTFAASSRS